jgi:hypothetical protein
MSESPEADTSDAPVPFVPPTPEALEQLLPQYGISQLIAHGGMGAVYSGVQLDLDRPVAIKILPPDAARDKESIERFRTEAKAMARLTHPHIPAVYEFGVFQGFCVLVMELVEGPNVYSMIRQGELTPAQALEVLAQVCDAVQFAHSRGIVHGDIKPGNILINQDGMVKLADFGLARLVGHGDRDSESWTPMGTPEYAAPELYDKNAVPDHRADIYSLGVVLHEMLTWAPPVGEFDLPGEGLGLDPRVDEVIARCMELVPENRYQTAAEVRTLLREIIEGRNVPARGPAKAPTKRIFRATRKVPLGAKRKPGSQKIAPGTQKKLGPGPPTKSRPAAVKSLPGKRVKKIVVMDGAGARRRIPENAKRNMLIGAAVLVVGIAVWLMTRKADTPVGPLPDDGKKATVQKDPLPNETTEIVPTPAPPAPEPLPPPPVTNPPPKPDPKPEPRPEPAPVAPTKAYAKIHELRMTYRDEWNSRVEDKLNDAMSRLSGLYSKALQALEDEYLGKGDAASVLAVRTEAERFENSREPVKPDAISKNPKIASRQQALNTEVQKLRAGLKYDSDSVRERYLLALRELEKKMDEADDKAGSKAVADEFQKATGLADSDLRNYFNAE